MDVSCQPLGKELHGEPQYLPHVSRAADGRQLAAIRRYIKMNPARYFWKQDNPDMFQYRANIRHPILNPALQWSAVGDITILASPFLYLVRLTMKKTAAELEDDITAHIERAAHGWTPVCGFISPGEREFERRLKALAYSRWIKTVPYGLPMRYDPSVEDSQWLAAHRQLVLSSFDRTEYPPFVIRRSACLAMNDRIAQMVAACDRGTFAHIASGHPELLCPATVSIPLQ